MVVYVNASTGDVTAARKLIGGALKAALGVRRWDGAPHYVTYQATPERRYVLDATNDERDRFEAELTHRGPREGWTQLPVDIYHD